jgi:hypothetical protein
MHSGDLTRFMRQRRKDIPGSMSEKESAEFTALSRIVKRMDIELQECRRLINQQAAKIEALERKTQPLNMYGGTRNL